MRYLTFGVRELQARLGAALRAVQAGERVLVLSRGRPVAVVSAVDAHIPDETAVERRLRRMAKAGRIRLGNGQPIAPFQPAPAGGASVRRHEVVRHPRVQENVGARDGQAKHGRKRHEGERRGRRDSG